MYNLELPLNYQLTINEQQCYLEFINKKSSALSCRARDR